MDASPHPAGTPSTPSPDPDEAALELQRAVMDLLRLHERASGLGVDVGARAAEAILRATQRVRRATSRVRRKVEALEAEEEEAAAGEEEEAEDDRAPSRARSLLQAFDAVHV